MILGLVYDTETTGLPAYSDPSNSPHQPHIVQLAAAMVDLETRIVLQSMNVIIKPNNWTIPSEVAAIHGISQEMAIDIGISEVTAVHAFIGLWERCGVRIAHNDSFDARIIRIALKRYGFALHTMDAWKTAEKYCTALQSKPILQLPPTEKMKATRFKNSFKMPKLEEAYKHFTGNDLEGAHNAMVDVEACLAVYFGIIDNPGTEIQKPIQESS